MVASKPRHCHPAAYDAFASALDSLETGTGLLNAAVAINQHADPSVSVDSIDAKIHSLAGRVRARLRSNDPVAILAHLHHELFEVEGFHGNVANYYDQRNSYVADVLETRCGLPITLALIYKSVAERLPLEVQGIGAPGHFLTQVTADGKPTLVDPFHGGRLLSRAEAIAYVEQVIGTQIPHDVDVLQPVTHAQWIARLLNNLQLVFVESKRPDDFAAMRELAELLPSL